MATRFVVPEKEKRVKLAHFGAALPVDLLAEFKRQAKRLRISQNKLLASMIAHCLQDLIEEEKPNDQKNQTSNP